MKIEKVPKHIGIILDGNRRFAKRLMMKPWMGHEWGAKKVEKLIEWNVKYKIKELTLYALSVQNFFSRPQNELNYLFNLFEKELKNLMNDEKISKHKIRINFIGRLNLFDNKLQELMKKHYLICKPLLKELLDLIQCFHIFKMKIITFLNNIEL